MKSAFIADTRHKPGEVLPRKNDDEESEGSHSHLIDRQIGLVTRYLSMVHQSSNHDFVPRQASGLLALLL